MTECLLLIASYLFGAMPFGLMIAKAVAGIDIREYGSHNIGATNVYRVVGKPAGALVFVLDVLKGLLPPLVARYMGMEVAWHVGAGLASIVGHNFSPFLSFHGGKGVATSLGVLFGVSWKVGIAAWALWGVILALTGYVSLGSLLAAISLGPFTLLFYPGDGVRLAFALIAGLFTLFRHRGNIQRLRTGTETSFKKKPPEQR